MCINQSPTSKTKKLLICSTNLSLPHPILWYFKADAHRKRNKYLEGELEHQNLLRQKHKREGFLTRPPRPPTIL